MNSRTCWILTEGHAGMEAQCRGLADALGIVPALKRVRVRLPWDWLPNRMWLWPLAAPTRDSDRLAPPWPDLIISCGNVSAPLAAAIRAESGGRTRAVHIQDPKMDLARFDLVIAPRHDGLAGANVMSSKAALHPVTPEKLAAGGQRWAAALAHLPRPLVAVLIGGSNGRHRLTPAVAARLADDLVRLARDSGGALAVTPSRRTGAGALRIIGERLAGLSADIWDGAGDNPYFGILGLADAVVVTGDSVNMVSEACATGKPVHVFDLDGGSAKFDRFHGALRARGITRRFEGRLESWRYDPPDDMARAVAAVRRRLGQSDAEPGKAGGGD